MGGSLEGLILSVSIQMALIHTVAYNNNFRGRGKERMFHTMSESYLKSSVFLPYKSHSIASLALLF